MKKAFSLVEIGFVLFIITAVFFTVIPLSVSNVKQARFIADWKDYIDQVKYSFETLVEYKKNRNISTEESVQRLISYLDGKKTDKKNLKSYKYKMMNGQIYNKMNLNKFDEVYIDVDKRIIGVEYGDFCRKDINVPCATVWTDINGKTKPNTVGKDIFIYEIYSGRIEPYGNGINFQSLKLDCSKTGTGMSCSKFYLLGGDLK